MDKKFPHNAIVTSVGHYVPDDQVIPNSHFEQYLETNDQWIQERTGIKERRWLSKDKPTSYLAVKAIEMLLDNRGIGPEEIDLIIFATVTPDMMFPASACIVQEKIGAKNAWGFDLSAACSGYLFALDTGAQFIRSGVHKKVIVVGADKMSSIIDFNDRNTCILFGDAGAALLLEPSEDPEYGILDSILRVDGLKGKGKLHMLGGGSLNPATHETVDQKMHYIYQDGRSVFKDAVVGMADVSWEIMKKNGLTGDDVSYLVPHQANMRIISACAERMGIGMDKVMVNIDRYGNTTAATIPLCISEYWQQGKVKKGDNLILSSFGAGYTWGSIYLKWAY